MLNQSPPPVDEYFNYVVNGAQFFYEMNEINNRRTAEITSIQVKKPSKLTVLGKEISIGSNISILGNVNHFNDNEVIFNNNATGSDLTVEHNNSIITSISFNFYGGALDPLEEKKDVTPLINYSDPNTSLNQFIINAFGNAQDASFKTINGEFVKKYVYDDGLLLYFSPTTLHIMEITSNLYGITSHNIKVGEKIYRLSNLYPESYKNINTRDKTITIPVENLENSSIILHYDPEKRITKIVFMNCSLDTDVDGINNCTDNNNFSTQDEKREEFIARNPTLASLIQDYLGNEVAPISRVHTLIDEYHSSNSLRRTYSSSGTFNILFYSSPARGVHRVTKY